MDPKLRKIIELFFGLKVPEFYGVQGSGVILQNKGVVITANHVVDLPNRTSLVAISSTGKKVGCSVLVQDKERDLALIQCDGFNTVRGINKLAPMTLRIGSRAVASGFASGGPLLMSDGIVANKIDDKGKLFLSIPAGPGMSGGGVFTYDGQLIGIIQMIYNRPPFTLITTNHLQVHRFLHQNRRFLDGNVER